VRCITSQESGTVLEGLRDIGVKAVHGGPVDFELVSGAPWRQKPCDHVVVEDGFARLADRPAADDDHVGVITLRIHAGV